MQGYGNQILFCDFKQETRASKFYYEKTALAKCKTELLHF